MNLAGLGGGGNAALEDVIRARIRADGPITFAKYMGLALYHADHGYYFRCDPALDYHSSPNVHPVFGAALARQLADFWRLLDRPGRFDVFEAGAGNGRLAADVLRHLRASEPALYEAIRYVLQDVTLRVDETLEVLQRAGIRDSAAEVADELPAADSIEGCVLSNELLDALPFHRVRKRAGRLWELRVGLDGERFVDVEATPGAEIEAYFAALGVGPGEGCDAEVNLQAPAWTRRAAAALRRGYLLTLDYGYEAADLYAPWRKRGTLLTFHRHTSGDDPYVRVGRQDITASVDFTSVRGAGEAAGLRTLGLTTQTDFLANLGIGQALSERPAPHELEAYYALRRAVIELTDPSGLGRIRVLVQGRDAPGAMPRGLISAAE